MDKKLSWHFDITRPSKCDICFLDWGLYCEVKTVKTGEKHYGRRLYCESCVTAPQMTGEGYEFAWPRIVKTGVPGLKEGMEQWPVGWTDGIQPSDEDIEWPAEIGGMKRLYKPVRTWTEEDWKCLQANPRKYGRSGVHHLVGNTAAKAFDESRASIALARKA
jgi:hypothetical protein